MPRVDVWDIPDPQESVHYDLGFKRGINEKYEWEVELGQGGFGSVRVVRCKKTQVQYACKSISKKLDVPGLAPIKQQQHLENIRREIAVLRKLRGTLNVVHLEEVLEDDTHVHIIMEWCRGGDLFQKIGGRHYSEQTAASYMRAVLRTIAQCHAHRILHRDIKPGNFMLLSDAADAPVKAIDFGLAVFYDPKQLPLTDLGLEGTPWYMAPEVLSSAVVPASDVWAAGVMAYQMLCGRFPFDDWGCPDAPRLSLVWRSILGEEPGFGGKAWASISPKAQDFCKQLLNKDPATRVSAREALSHPWLAKGRAKGAGVKQRAVGDQLGQVVQRLQRYSQQNAFKRSVLDMMANELLSRHVQMLQQEEQEMAEAQEEGLDEEAEDSGDAEVHTSQDMELHSEVAPGSSQGVGRPGLTSSPLPGPGVRRSRSSRDLDGSLHGLVARARSSRDGGSQEGSMHSRHSMDNSVHRSMRSFRGAAGALSALEALRRARERRSAVDLPAAAGGEEAGAAHVQMSTSPHPRMAPLAAAAAGASPGLEGYRGPVKDPGAASAWDFSFMANRLALEGSAHGNPHAARLLRARLSQEFQRPTRLEGTWHGPSTARPTTAAALAALAAAGHWVLGSSPPRVAGSPPHLGEEVVLEPPTKRAASINVAILQQQQRALAACQAEQQLQGAPGRSDRSWHAGAAGAAAATEDFHRFLEQARRQRQEQRKVARLVLESSTHGGKRYPDHLTSGDGLGGVSEDAQEGSRHKILGAMKGFVRSVSGVFQRGGLKSPEPSVKGASLLPVPSPAVRHLLPTPSTSSPATAPSQPGRSLLPGPSSRPSPPPPPAHARHALLPVPSAAAGGSTPTPAVAEATPAPPAAAPRPAWEPAPAALSQAPLPVAATALAQVPGAAAQPSQPSSDQRDLEVGKRGHGAYAALMAASEGGVPASSSTGGGAAAGAAQEPTSTAAAEAGPRPRAHGKQVGFAEAPSIRTISRTSELPQDSTPLPSTPLAGPAADAGHAAAAHSLAAKLQAVEAAHQASHGGSAAAAAAAAAGAAPLQDVRQLLQQMFAGEHDVLTVEQLQQRLADLGHRLAPSEVAHLARQVGLGEGEVVGLSQFAASQLEWADMQINHREEWLSCLRATFDGLDKDRDGRIRPDDIIQVLAGKLPEAEVNAALEDVLLEAAADEDEGLDFAAFQALLTAPAMDSVHGLDQYDARLLRTGDSPDGTGHGTVDAAAALAASPRTDASS